ncbi:MAG: LysR substrate-binding domain-containing protein [Alphaproteobacteria bacterium]
MKRAFTAIGDDRREAASQQTELAGLLRVGGPAPFAAAHIVPVMAELVARHPRLEIELKVSGRERDLVAERLDIAVRIREMRSSTLKARRLGEVPDERLISALSHISGDEIASQAKQVQPLFPPDTSHETSERRHRFDRTEVRSGSLCIPVHLRRLFNVDGGSRL